MSGQNFIGSKISLTSNSDIRYEGTLHSLNTEESTVALEQVRSFGTEGRRGNPEEEIPPSENVFEFVVFRGSDIKDLKIFEPPAKAAPPPPPPANVPSDPAIMSSVMKGYGANAAMNPYMMPPYPAMQQQQHPQQYWGSPMYGMPPPMGGAINPAMQQQQQQQQQQPPLGSAPLSNRTMPGMPAEQTSAAPVGPPSAHNAAIAAAREDQPGIAEKPKKEVEPKNAEHVSTETAVKALEESLDNLEIVKDEKGLEDDQRAHHQQNRQRRYNNNNNNNYGNTGRGGGARRHDYNNTNNNTNNNNAAKQPIEIPKSDFDFESSNAKFKKEELAKAVTKKTVEEEEQQSVEDQQEDEEVVIPPSDESFYDKDKSFFDNISCESKERSEQDQNGIDRRAKFQEERKLNLETFGEASVDRPRYRGFRGRGGYRGRGSGGYQRGGGGRYGGFRGNNNRGNLTPKPLV
ncbi:Scd6-like Sm domain-containing protein [Zychaea mexicana]|uniref:Scd6-like Sm domain-containing protein n=1 Tax=Zychaea mexicana TaxID=64656 RepID=UPI0022FEF0C4|nr:Scd6-like Sm domain-containing protein [Zychaea mexicana]KAI9490727.1 Scd6-like Sm domain-containing protein [Zychaea mexicana]